MYYTEIAPEELMKLRDGLDILQKLGRDVISSLDIHVYGITSAPGILDAAREAIAADSGDELSEEDIQLTEIAVALPASSDTLYYLTGSGVKLGRGDEFAYQGQAGEGIRTVDFAFARIKPQASAGDFKNLALADSDAWIDKFLTQYGTKVPIRIEVERSRPSTGIPVASPGTPKQTSVPGMNQLRDLMENFLG